MMLHIDDHLTVSEVQDRFEECFPGLKIEFYSTPHHPGMTTDDKYLILPECRIGDIRKIHNRGELVIMSWYPVERVEREFRKKFGLNVQIFRAVKDAWVQTGESDKLSLSEQRRLSLKMKNKEQKSDKAAS